MPRACKRSTLKAKCNVMDEDHEKTAKVNEMYRNWLSGAKSQRKILEKHYEDIKRQKFAEIDQVMFKLGTEVLNMTVEEFCNLEDLDEKKTPEQPKTEELKSLPTVQPMEIPTDDIMCTLSTINQALQNLQQQTSESSGCDTKEKPAKGKRKRAPPKTARRAKQKPSKSVSETPCNPIPAGTWQDTAFYTPQVRPRAPRTAAKYELKDIVAKVIYVTKTGSPVTFVPESPRLRDQIQKTLRNMEEKAMHVASTE